MIRIADTTLVRTRLTLAAWVGAGIATLLSMVSSLVQFSYSGAAIAEQAHYANVTELLGFLRAL